MSDESFRVVPESLVRLASALSTAARHWNDVALRVDGTTMQSFDLGLIGEAKDYPGRYNELKDQVYTQLNQGVEVWQGMAEALTAVAETYVAKDAEWYEQYGYLAESQD